MREKKTLFIRTNAVGLYIQIQSCTISTFVRFVYRRVVYGEVIISSKATLGETFGETGWSAYGLFRTHRYHLELNRVACKATFKQRSFLGGPPPTPTPLFLFFFFFSSSFSSSFFLFFFLFFFFSFQCCFTSTETTRLIRDGKQRS